MRLSSLFRVFFVIYCVEAGVFLVLAPWTAVWDRLLIQLPLTELRSLVLAPWLRAAVSGFGLVHLVWGAHDLNTLLTLRRNREHQDPS